MPPNPALSEIKKKPPTKMSADFIRSFVLSALGILPALCGFAWYNMVHILGVAPSVRVLLGPIAVSVVVSAVVATLNTFHLRRARNAERLNIRELEATQVDLIRTLSETAEARSGDTGEHLRRVAACTRALAQLSGKTQVEAEAIAIASPLHDIGKLATPDSVLNKPGKLNEEELSIMRTHAKAGHDMLANSSQPLLLMGSRIAYGHHEKWDGSGYPQGLRGDAIPEEARIVAIADVFDALASKRVYKEAWSETQIRQYFTEESGRHFDPALCQLFLDNLDSFMSIRSGES